MRPAEFVEKWSDSALRERQGSQEHFIDLCRLLGEPTPAEDDKAGERYCFERGAAKTGGGDGWADVWRKGCFAWEYKGPRKDLNAALRQLVTYARDLENPPYLVVSDMSRIVVHTNWTNTVPKTHEIRLEELLDPARRELLRQVFTGSEKLKPGLTPQDLTSRAAATFGELGRRLQDRRHPPRAVAHFLNRLVFCMFAEDAGLLPDKLFTRTILNLKKRPKQAARQLGELFRAMSDKEVDYFGADSVRWFNGGLFDGDETLPLTVHDIELIADTAEAHDWSEIDPSIFGTLFEQALKATRERPALGAHYTDREKILKIVDPVVIRPLEAEWATARAEIAAAKDEVAAADDARRAVHERAADAMKEDPVAAKAGEPARRKELTAIARRRDAALGRAKARLEAHLARLGAFRVLDPACGSGNFLYVALHALMDLERRALVDAERLGLIPPAPRVGLQCVRGIEIDPYAAELARLTLWIGYLQWLRKNESGGIEDPVLSSLDQIENRDALLNEDGTEAGWPQADAIVGNPPFLGGKLMRANLGDGYVDRLFAAYRGRVPAEADFVCYWVEKAWRAIEAGAAGRAGLVTTNSIRGGANRRVLDPIAAQDAIHEAWADEAWVLDGAAVRVSMIGFGNGFVERRVEGTDSPRINADLTAHAVDLTNADALPENADVAFMGDTKGGAFDVPGSLARQWLSAPLNPNGRPNSDVVRPWINDLDVTRRSRDMWIVDFRWEMTEAEAALFEAPFRYLLAEVEADRRARQSRGYAKAWWRHERARPEMWDAIAERRYIVTPTVAKHRIFVFSTPLVCPDHQLIAIARDDDTTFGVLHSRFHELWSLRLGTSLEDRPRYTPSTTFETFPFPEDLTPDVPAADYAGDPRAIRIAEAARRLDALRQVWLNPPDLVEIVPEIVPTAAPGEAPVKYPDRVLPKDEAAAKELRKRTLTNLYNERPRWLADAHAELDCAVAAAYGWPEDLSDEQILERLFALNQERAAKQGAAKPKRRGRAKPEQAPPAPARPCPAPAVLAAATRPR